MKKRVEAVVATIISNPPCGLQCEVGKDNTIDHKVGGRHCRKLVLKNLTKPSGQEKIDDTCSEQNCPSNEPGVKRWGC